MTERELEGLRIRLALDMAGVSRQAVAAEAGVSPSMVSKWLAGERRAGPRARAAILRLLRDAEARFESGAA